jgi:hypothetical protein
LWRVVQQSEVTARLEGAPTSSVQLKLMAAVNTFAMLNGVYVDDDDRRLAHEYVSSVLDFLGLLDQADRPEYRDMASANQSA